MPYDIILYYCQAFFNSLRDDNFLATTAMHNIPTNTEDTRA